MATPTVANVLKSGASIWYAATGTAEPDETTVAYGAAWGGTWAQVGFTKEPLVFAYEDEHYDIEVQEHLAPIKRVRTKENLTVETVLAELTASYLLLANARDITTGVATTAAGAAQKGFEEAGLGGVAELEEMAWGFEGQFIDSTGVSQPVRVFIHKGTAKLNGNLEFSKKTDDYVGIPIQIKALADTTQDPGEELCIFQRVTAPITGAG